jgi:hypothetical protein
MNEIQKKKEGNKNEGREKKQKNHGARWPNILESSRNLSEQHLKFTVALYIVLRHLQTSK